MILGEILAAMASDCGATLEGCDNWTGIARNSALYMAFLRLQMKRTGKSIAERIKTAGNGAERARTSRKTQAENNG